MTAFHITEMKKFMAGFLAGDCFDSFLLEEAFVETAVTYHIDGHVNAAFFAQGRMAAPAASSRGRLCALSPLI